MVGHRTHPDVAVFLQILRCDNCLKDKTHVTPTVPNMFLLYFLLLLLLFSVVVVLMLLFSVLYTNLNYNTWHLKCLNSIIIFSDVLFSPLCLHKNHIVLFFITGIHVFIVYSNTPQITQFYFKCCDLILGCFLFAFRFFNSFFFLLFYNNCC